MARLSLSLLGPFRVTLDAQPVTAFKSNKVRALLAYLAVEAEVPHCRETLAGLFWPDWPNRDALSNLRYALSDLRDAIGDRTASPPFLLISRDSVQFNQASDYSLDVSALTNTVSLETALPEQIEQLQHAVAQYHGRFMEGFTLADSHPFEEWQLLTQERLTRTASGILEQLATLLERRGELERAQTCARQRLELEPWDESAHRRLMRLLALNDQRTAALAQYENCRRSLAAELGVEPAEETTQLYLQIRDGKLKPAPAALPIEQDHLARFFDRFSPAADTTTFVARGRELKRLAGFWKRAVAGEGTVVFVTGEAGSGKSTLLQEFARRIQADAANVVVASGSCNAYTGVGDPYLPFREILDLLTGGVEARLAAGAMTRDHALRLWQTLPCAAQSIAESGPGLIDTFVPRAALLQRAGAFAGDQVRWLSRLRDALDRRPESHGMPGTPQADLFDQYTRVLQDVSGHAPLTLILDDLQWADLGTISLLFHLSRRLRGSRILVVGAYRPEEVAIGRQGERHPLEPVANELQRYYGNTPIDLGQAESRDFVDAILDSEPNCFEPEFREMLHRQTRGHPLFTIELLRGLQDRGDLLQDAAGRWHAGPALDWDSLPARVEAVIAERIGRLPEPLRSALRVASVEGETFTAEVVARVCAADERSTLERLSSELDKRHRLVSAQSIERIDGQLLSRYRFRHILFQRFLYRSLDEIERAHLHEAIGDALEALCFRQQQKAAIAVQLAMHFHKARNTEKTVSYLHMAGDRAIRLAAYPEGRLHLTRALDLLMTLPESPERAGKELGLQLSLGIAWMGDLPRPGWENAVMRAHELCQQTGNLVELSSTIGQLATIYYVRGDYEKAQELAAEALTRAEEAGDPVLVAFSHWYVGFVLFGVGRLAEARAHLVETISSYRPQQHHHAMVLLRGSDAGVGALAYDACCLWCLGYPEQALARSRQALATARELGHAFSLADVLCFAGCLLSTLTRDAEALAPFARELTDISERMDLESFAAVGRTYYGHALAQLGDLDSGLQSLRGGLEGRAASDTRCQQSILLDCLAEAQMMAGQREAARETLDEALAAARKMDERFYEAELHRHRGELLLALGDGSEAEASLQRALEVARKQGAKMLELRAATSLSRLWQAQGRRVEARNLLAPVYAWFTEGFDTADLQSAAGLLHELR